MVSKSELEILAKKLMFEMKDSEYETLEKEFDIILKQMDLIGNIKDIDKVSPMTFPFESIMQPLRYVFIFVIPQDAHKQHTKVVAITDKIKSFNIYLLQLPSVIKYPFTSIVDKNFISPNSLSHIESRQP